MATDATGTPLDEAARRIEAGAFVEALALLGPVAAGDATGRAHALVGLARYRLADYAAAADSYDRALLCTPDEADWQAMAAQARANATARLDIHVPPVVFFDRHALLRPAYRRAITLPEPLRRVRPGWHRRSLRAIGDGLGLVAGLLFGGLTDIYGRLAGYRGAVWTLWYRRPFPLNLLTLAHMRDLLNRRNLHPAYPEGDLTGLQPPDQEPPPGAAGFRTPDGTWNALDDPAQGAAGTRFARNADTRPETGDRLLTPNPREVSRVLLTRGETMAEVPFLNLLAAAWIQFETHDWVSHGETRADAGHDIPLAADDPLRARYRTDRLSIGRTQADPTADGIGDSFINEVTHWWDGSQVYGSDPATCNRLREHVGGRLRIGTDGRLPVGAGGVEDTGFTRNWWVGLSLFHTLFVREHNAICAMLATHHPEWDDDRLFATARLVNAAVMAKIHTIEWTPAILPDDALNTALNANWYGLATAWLHPPGQRRTVAAINIRHPELGGVVGNPIDRHGVPYALTEEFTEVYRLHPLLPEALDLRRHGDGAAIEAVPMTAARQAGSPALTARVAMADLVYSFGTQAPGALELNNYPRFLQDMAVPGNPVVDLAAVDILRARERGVPRYNEFRRRLQLNPIRGFEDLTDDPGQIAALRQVYGDDVEALDLLVGTLAEAPSRRPSGFGFGETLFQIFILNATRRLQADRFYTTCYNARTYTQEGLDWIDAATLKSVLLRHHPELAATGLANVSNAFEPWDDAERLDPARHPLRAFDRSLRPDPWVGERCR